MKTAVFLIVLMTVATHQIGHAQTIIRVANNPLPANRFEKPPIFSNPNKFMLKEEGIFMQDADQQVGSANQSDVPSIPSLRKPIGFDAMSRAVNNDQDVSSERAMFNYVSNSSFAPNLRNMGDCTTQVKTWKSPNMYTRPLYFEDENLERYGNHREKWQPLVSGAKFVKDTVTLPYQIGRQHPNCCSYTLGYYRPGNCNPAWNSKQPFSKRGAALQGMVSLALFYGL